ncbi:1-deoxy-D-xylulose-5-phosphate reductoisomerase [Chthonobacter rhizosphaerae]|uniref:1-deoxy-D-xylulose-5-phosphate reductoisomerase n=1 Tax=Chthonobacter rhizosphaerae TaxID=2735553 RepID=UPI0015EE3A9F|nr:1-deoxy-D-xylulose-5-phosphate reductoisomerase [Chthonobacter rhizosphaerae]
MHLPRSGALAPSSRSGPLRISVLGATGSIGTSTLDLIGREPDRFDVVALTAQSNTAALAEAAVRVGAAVAVIGDETAYGELAERLAGTGVAAAAGPDAIVEAAARPADLVVSAIVGAAGLAPSLAALGAAEAVALANKETLVSAGTLFMTEAVRRGVRVLPVDSEHNAIFQVLDAENIREVAEIILTASGGPFRTLSLAEMAGVTPERALKHPNWSMGRKISIDSATLMNKGLELIEAHHLFPVRPDQLSVVVHPQSAVHGLVRYTDGSLLAELGSADMRTPIAHCLAWPERRPAPVAPLDLVALGTLTFEAPDRARFPCLALAEAALAEGRGAPCVLNAANEIAVEAFLDGRIRFLDIAAVVADTLSRARGAGMMAEPASLVDAESLDASGRRLAAAEVARRMQ